MNVYNLSYAGCAITDSEFDAMVNLSLMDAGSKRIECWLRDTGLFNKCRIGVIGVYDPDKQRLNACAKVIVAGANPPDSGSFIHEELYITFPSDHFKAKVLLVTGGA